MIGIMFTSEGIFLHEKGQKVRITMEDATHLNGLKPPPSRPIIFQGRLYFHHDNQIYCYNEKLGRMLDSSLGKLAACSDKEEPNAWEKVGPVPGLTVDEIGYLTVDPSWVKEQHGPTTSAPALQGSTPSAGNDLRG